MIDDITALVVDLHRALACGKQGKGRSSEYLLRVDLFVDLDRLAGTEIKKPTALRRLT